MMQVFVLTLLRLATALVVAGGIAFHVASDGLEPRRVSVELWAAPAVVEGNEYVIVVSEIFNYSREILAYGFHSGSVICTDDFGGSVSRDGLQQSFFWNTRSTVSGVLLPIVPEVDGHRVESVGFAATHKLAYLGPISKVKGCQYKIKVAVTSVDSRSYSLEQYDSQDFEFSVDLEGALVVE